MSGQYFFRGGQRTKQLKGPAVITVRTNPLGVILPRW